MARDAVYRQSTGPIPNSGAAPPIFPPCRYCFETPPSPMLSKISLLELSHTTLSSLGRRVPPCVSLFPVFSVYPYSTFHRESASYHEVKQAATAYQAAKRCLLSPGAPFAGWVVSGEEWESFDARGDLRSEAQA